MITVWPQNYSIWGQGLAVSALAAGLPVVVLLFLLGVQRKPAWVASLWGLGVTFLVALAGYRMPFSLALSSAAYGAAFGLFPICWIVFWAIVLYNITLVTGKFVIIKDSVASLTPDMRIQAIMIAFGFGGFLEGAAGFGNPGSRCRRHDGGPGIFAVLRFRPLPSGKYRAGSLWFDRYSRHYPGRNHRPSPGETERSCRNAVRARRADPSPLHDLGDGRMEGGQGSVARPADRGVNVRNHGIRDFQLRRRPTERYPRAPRRPWLRSSCCCDFGVRPHDPWPHARVAPISKSRTPSSSHGKPHRNPAPSATLPARSSLPGCPTSSWWSSFFYGASSRFRPSSTWRPFGLHRARAA